jgi:hypothetical protein
MLSHPLLDQLDWLLGDRVPPESVEFAGEWRMSSRRTYTSEAQVGSGSGPFTDVIDLRWQGTLTSTCPISGIAFLLTPDNLYWVKAPEVSPTLSVEVSLHAYAGYTVGGATFTGSLAGASLPGVPVPGSEDLAGTCTLGPDVLTTGRVTCLAHVSSAAFFVLPIQRGLLKVGRKRLWRLGDDVASLLPPDVRELLTHRRTGVVRSPSR